jgi:heme/copper-type cytochrome/quinol oxidase subunit 2
MVDLMAVRWFLNWKNRGIIYFVMLVLSLLDFVSTYQALGNAACAEENPIFAQVISNPDLALQIKITHLICPIIVIEIFVLIYFIIKTYKKRIPESKLDKLGSLDHLEVGVSIILIIVFSIVLFILSITVINNYLCYFIGHTFL